MPPSLSPLWLLIGDWSGVRAHELRRLLDHQRCEQMPSLSEALLLASTHAEPIDAVLVLQTVPDEYAPQDIDRLIGLLPLARWIVAVGDWCESLGRTEQHWPVGWCVPLRNAGPRLLSEIQRMTHGEPPLPPTASRDEAFAFFAKPRTTTSYLPSRQAYVCGDDFQSVGTLSELLAAAGCVVTDSPNAEFNVIATTTPCSATSTHLKELRGQQTGARLWVATDLVTPEETRALREAGADAVVSQLRFQEALTAFL